MSKKYEVQMLIKENGKNKWVNCSTPMSYEDCWAVKNRIKLTQKNIRLRISEVR